MITRYYCQTTIPPIFEKSSGTDLIKPLKPGDLPAIVKGVCYALMKIDQKYFSAGVTSFGVYRANIIKKSRGNIKRWDTPRLIAFLKKVKGNPLLVRIDVSDKLCRTDLNKYIDTIMETFGLTTIPY